MSDQNQDPPVWNGLVKPINPDEFGLGGPVPTEKGTAPAQDTASAQEKPPMSPPKMSTEQSKVSQFQFQYLFKGKTYRATIFYNSMSGYDINLEKWTGSGWSPSVSRLKNALLASFIVQQMVQATGHPADEASGPQYTPDAEVPIADQSGPKKQPVKG